MSSRDFLSSLWGRFVNATLSQLRLRCPLQYYFVSPPGRRRGPAIETTRRWLQEAPAATLAGMERYWGEPLRARSDAQRKSVIDRHGEDSG